MEPAVRLLIGTEVFCVISRQSCGALEELGFQADAQIPT